jgi:hypothetical protein
MGMQVFMIACGLYMQMGLVRTGEAFEAEWYELKATGRLEGASAVPDVYVRNAVRVPPTG